jgi:hypothetical protein
MFSIKNLIIAVVVIGIGALVWMQQNAPVESVLEPTTEQPAPKQAAPKSAEKPDPEQPDMEPTAIPNLYGDAAEALVTAQVKAYAAMDLGGMLETFHPDIEHIDLKGGGRIEGLDVSWKVFGDMFRQVKWLKAEVLQKQVVGDVVIFLEKLEDSEDPEAITYSLVAHQLKDGLIRKIWYYNGLPSETTEVNSGVSAVNAQLLAYNNRDLEAFLAPYALDVKIEDLTIEPNDNAYEGHEAMRPRYTRRFQSEGLNAQIRARLIHGNFVIDQEYVTWAGLETPIQVIAIYLVDNNLIQNVWFLKPEFK